MIVLSARFFLTAAILKYYGPALLAEFERRMTLYVLVGGGLLAAAVIAWKVLA